MNYSLRQVTARRYEASITREAVNWYTGPCRGPILAPYEAVRARFVLIPSILFMFILVATPASAQDKTDVVTLRNGDRITGDVTTLSRGRLKLKTDDVGTIDIEWDNIRTVQAKRLFEVTTSDGRLRLGSLGGTTPGTLVVTNMLDVVTLQMIEVTNLSPIGSSFWTKLEGAISAGFSFTHSSGIAQTTFNSDTQYRRPSFLVRLTGSATVTEQEGQENDDRAAISMSYIRYRGKWFTSMAGRLENNQSLGLVLRSQVGGIIGRRPFMTNRAEFAYGAGLVGNNEQAVDASATQNIEAVIGLQGSYYTYDDAKTSFDGSFQYYPSLNQWGRQRIQIDTALTRDLPKDMTVSFSLYYSFDSKPPQAGADRTDVGLVTSLGWTFGR
jgi:hypothetical protein